jgi:Family of unknown function (DUF6144)
MKRKDFLSKGVCACIGTGALLTGQSKAYCASVSTKDGEGTPCEEKSQFAQVYIKRLMDVFNDKLDESTRVDLVQTMGERCARGAYGDKETATDKIPVTEFAKKLNAREEGNCLYWEYKGNPKGLTIADGWCLCPLTEKGPENLSGLWCECSVGYVKYMFERYSTSKVKVELLESLKRGGKGCRFKVTLLDEK